MNARAEWQGQGPRPGRLIGIHMQHSQRQGLLPWHPLYEQEQRHG
jgi:hypothetical protein